MEGLEERVARLRKMREELRVRRTETIEREDESKVNEVKMAEEEDEESDDDDDDDDLDEWGTLGS